MFVIEDRKVVESRVAGGEEIERAISTGWGC